MRVSDGDSFGALMVLTALLTSGISWLVVFRLVWYVGSYFRDRRL